MTLRVVYADSGETVAGIRVRESSERGGVRVLGTRMIVRDGREWRVTMLGAESPRRVRVRDLPAWYGSWRTPRRAGVPRRSVVAIAAGRNAGGPVGHRRTGEVVGFTGGAGGGQAG